MDAEVNGQACGWQFCCWNMAEHEVLLSCYPGLVDRSPLPFFPRCLSRAVKELIIGVSSVANRCPNSVVGHSDRYRVYSKNLLLSDQVSACLCCASGPLHTWRKRSPCYRMVERARISSFSHCLSSSLHHCPSASVCMCCLEVGLSWAPALYQTWYWILGRHSLECTQLTL